MNWGRIGGLSHRVMLQIFRDRRTFILLIVIPILLLVLADLLFESETEGFAFGVANSDRGIELPGGTTISLSEEIIKGIDESTTFSLKLIDESELESSLEAGSLKAALVIPDGFTLSFVRSGEMVLELDLEGSNPAISGTIAGVLIPQQSHNGVMFIKTLIYNRRSGSKFSTTAFVASAIPR